MAPETRTQAKRNDKRKAPMVEENEVEAMETESFSGPRRSPSPNVQAQQGIDMQQLTLLVKQAAQEAVETHPHLVRAIVIIHAQPVVCQSLNVARVVVGG